MPKKQPKKVAQKANTTTQRLVKTQAVDKVAKKGRKAQGCGNKAVLKEKMKNRNVAASKSVTVAGKTEKKKKKLSAETLSKSQLEGLATICFDSLREKLTMPGEKKMKKDSAAESSSLLNYKLDGEVSCPLFVTWLIGKKKQLRGCIGSFEPLSLNTGLRDFALVSAFEDDRFNPIRKEEFENLHVSLSLLVRHATEPLADPLDWQIGKHGVSLEITGADGELYESTFLPEVAKEQKWTQLETLSELLEKAGFEEADVEDVLDRVKIYTYESIVVKMSHAEYTAATLRRKKPAPPTKLEKLE